MPTRRSALLALLVAPVAVFVAACGDATVSSGDIESQITKQLGPKLPQKVKSVSCPDDLTAKTGKSENCVLTLQGGAKVEVKASVTKVTDSKASLDFLVTKQLA